MSDFNCNGAPSAAVDDRRKTPSMERYILVPELKQWDAHNGGSISPEAWASCIGSYSLAIAYASLFWPRFIEIKGMVFRDCVDQAEVDQWLASTHQDIKLVEATINHFHILDIQHPGAWADVSEAQIRFLGETLRAAWSAKLSIDYPERKFVVELIAGAPADDLREYQIVFYQAEGADPPINTDVPAGNAARAGRI